jgi:prepilin-type N-terminal cleavage/methylation domain-containing protein
VKKGFTLIELMIVVVIIGILAAIAIPKFGAVKDQAEESACRSNMRSIASAEAMYYGKYNTYGDIDALSGAGGMMENANVTECPTADAGYTITAGADTYSLPCPNADPNHGSVEDGITSWQSE